MTAVPSRLGLASRKAGSDSAVLEKRRGSRKRMVSAENLDETKMTETCEWLRRVNLRKKLTYSAR